SPSGKYLAMLIKPKYSETRQARIDKKRGDDMPKDSLGIFSLASGNLIKVPAVKSFRLPEEKGDYVLYMADQEVAEKASAADTANVTSPEAPERRGAANRKKT